ncbi:MAG: hypothetical protein CMJ58_07490 [Planctomycetaceae bacterium]|nr:hypothetical protein [Planctomycetaceae bacterium]
MTTAHFPGISRHFRVAAALATALAALAAIPSWAQDEGAEPAADAVATDAPATAPIQRIVLFNSGVGYFERGGTISGDATISLQFAVDDINDLLKSMVVQDLDGGSVSTVTYGSRDPVARTLATFAIDLTSEPSLGDLLRQIRGERILLEAPMPIEGAIVGVEKQRRQLGDDQTVEVELLTLLTSEGLRRVQLDAVGRIQLARPELDTELRQALTTLALGHSTDKKTVSLNFAGEGQRDVRIGYILEAPVWKTSYRLVLSEDEQPYLQGWAIVENTTDSDWTNVQLSLVSGRPISFAMDLYSPLFATRPQVTPELYATLAPQLYDQDLDLSEEAEEEVREQLARRVAGRGVTRGYGGGSGGYGVVADAAVAADMPASAPAELGRTLKSSVAAAAEGGDVGELFQYEIAVPVTLARQSSAMLPIVNQQVGGSKVSIYNQAVHDKHPLNGIRLENTSDLHLMQGPVTVFDDGVYAGDARIPDLPAGGERLLSYAMDLDVEVAPQTHARPQSLVAVKIVRGTLQTSYQQEREQTYAIKNSGDAAKSLLVEYPHDAGQSDWQLVAPAEPTERTRDAYRFAVDAPAGETVTLEIKERRTISQSVALRNINDGQVAIYLRSDKTPAAVKEALRDVQRRQAEVAELERQMKDAEGRINAIAAEQDRIRNNMRAIDRNTDLYNRYVKKFNDQETEVEQLRETVAELKEQIAAKQRELDEFVANLTIGVE